MFVYVFIHVNLYKQTGTPLLNIAIDAAEDSKNSDVISLLLRHGANPLLTDKVSKDDIRAKSHLIYYNIIKIILNYNIIII